MNIQRFRSLSEIEKTYQSSDNLRIPLFDKQSADFCFEKSCAILSKPFTLALTPDDATLTNSQHKIGKRSTTSDSRDFIGDNLLDIENTLKALNLDFLNAFNELEKTDSAETLFGEHSYPYEATNNPKLRNSALKLSKLTHNYNLGGKSDFGSPKSIKSMQFSPSGEGVGGCVKKSFMGSSQFFCADPQDEKRSSTPDTGFASRETTSSRRGSQKSSYSPQDSTSRFSPREFNYPVSGAIAAYISEHSAATRKLSSSPSRTAHSSINSINSIHPPASSSRRFDYHPTSIEQSFATRKRSMSFTENYDLKSPVLSEPPPPSVPPKIEPPFDVAAAVRRMHMRATSVYKPRSIKARNLRRLSYNPIVLDSSSSSNSDSDFDKSIAHSECDIRSTGRRRRQYTNRKSNTVDHHHQQPDKLYGSNASIKSAPQYNYASDRQLHKYLDQKFNLRGGDAHSGALYDYINGRIVAVESAAAAAPLPYQQKLSVETPSAFSRHSALFSEFDVSKLTGKSPTTHCFLNELFPVDKSPIGVPSTPPPSAASIHSNKAAKSAPVKTTASGGAFQWPEKIHASAVKQNDLLWRNQNTAKLVAGQSYSSDSSSTETGGCGGKNGGNNRSQTTGSSSLGFRSEFGAADRATMPPSPAP